MMMMAFVGETRRSFVFVQVNEFGWNPCASYPPVRSCVFSSGFTDVMFVGDPSSSNNLPRGTLIFTTQPIPHQVTRIVSLQMYFIVFIFSSF